MKKIYKTKLLEIREDLWLSPHKKIMVNKDFYTPYKTHDELKKYLFQNKVSTEGIRPNDLVKEKYTGNCNNSTILIPKYLLTGEIYVTKTIFPNTVREIVTGKLFKTMSYGQTTLNQVNCCSVDSYMVEVLKNSESGLAYLKNYLLNADIIRYKINLSIEKSNDVYCSLLKDINERIKESEKEKQKEKEKEQNIKTKRKQELEEIEKIIKKKKNNIKKLLKDNN